MRRQEDIRAKQGGRPGVFDQVAVVTDQDADPHAQPRLDHCVAVAAQDMLVLKGVQLAVACECSVPRMPVAMNWDFRSILAHDRVAPAEASRDGAGTRFRGGDLGGQTASRIEGNAPWRTCGPTALVVSVIV